MLTPKNKGSNNKMLGVSERDYGLKSSVDNNNTQLEEIACQVPCVNGTLDYSNLIQSAIDEVFSKGGGKVLLERGGTYPLLSTIDIKKKVELSGNGGIAENTLRSGGSTKIIIEHTGWGFEGYVGESSCTFDGFIISNLSIKSSETIVPLGGIWADNVSNCKFLNINISGFSAGTGVKLGSDSSNGSQYHEFYGCLLCNNQIGLNIYDSNGTRFFGGFINSYAGGAAAVPSGTIGIKTGSNSDSFKTIGTVFQYLETAIENASTGSDITDCRFEAFDKGIIIKENTRGVTISGGSMSNYIVSGTGTGIEIEDGSAAFTIHGIRISDVVSEIIDNRTDINSANYNVAGMQQVNGAFVQGIQSSVGIPDADAEDVGLFISHKDTSSELDTNSSASIGVGFSTNSLKKWGGFKVRRENAFGNTGQLEFYTWNGGNESDVKMAMEINRAGRVNIPINDLDLQLPNSGIRLTDSNGNSWKITVDTTGTLITTSI